jgi:transcriptional regulator with XRE-family HTH domain
MESTKIRSRLPSLIKAKRREGSIGLREAATESKVSPSTLSRLERGITEVLPDTDTLKKLATWLNISLDEMLIEEKLDISDTPKLTTPEEIEVNLRADKNLSPETAKALADAFKILYEQFTKNNE